MATMHSEWRVRTTTPAWVMVLVAIGVSYLGIYVLAPRVPGPLSFPLLQPLCYLFPAGIALWLMRGDWRALLPVERTLPFVAGALALGQISLAVIAGVWFGGFGNSPYSHSPFVLLTNLWFIAALLAGHEVSRWFLVRALQARGESFALMTVWILFWLAQLSPYSLTRLSHPETLFKYLGLIVLPLAGRELLATRLALAGGPIVALAYTGLLTLFEWMSPILPTPSWLIMACLGIMMPIAGLALIDSLQANGEAEVAEATGEATTRETAQAQEHSGSGVFWLVSAVIALLIFWFNTGIFGVYPTLVHGISMEPTMHTGDVSVIRRVPIADLRTGDVIQFYQSGRYVIHRIIKIESKDGHTTITTQGDNVYSPDEPIDEKAIKGKMLFFVPKVGMVPIELKILLDKVLP